MWKKVQARALELWHSIPPAAQAVIVLFATTVVTFLGQAGSHYLLEPEASCWQWKCVRHILVSAIAAGVVAVRAFYMRPGAGPQAQLQK